MAKGSGDELGMLRMGGGCLSVTDHLCFLEELDHLGTHSPKRSACIPPAFLVGAPDGRQPTTPCRQTVVQREVWLRIAGRGRGCVGERMNQRGDRGGPTGNRMADHPERMEHLHWRGGEGHSVCLLVSDRG